MALARRRVLASRACGAVEVPAGGDTEFGEHLAHVPFDGAGADEQLRGDLGVGAPVPCQPDDVLLLRGELALGVHLAFAGLLASGEQFPAGAFGEGLCADVREKAVGGVELPAGVEAAVLPAQPFAIEEVGAGVMVAAPLAALDIPLKVLVWQDRNGAVSVSYNSPGFLAGRHHLDGAPRAPFDAVESIVAALPGT